MIGVIVNGANGQMGKELVRMIAQSEDFSLAAAVDAMKNGDGVLAGIAQYEGPAQAIIDFSHHTAAPAVTSYAAEHGIALVVATTGHTPQEEAMIREAAKKTPVFWAANMSVGVAVLVDLAKQAAKAFPDADIEIVEAHHNRKKDAPSGTALKLANEIASVRENATIATGREGMGQRVRGEITVHALRMGNIVGEHEVFITTDTQQIAIGHKAYSRALFAEGALAAARFLQGKAPGLYSMEDMINE